MLFNSYSSADDSARLKRKVAKLSGMHLKAYSPVLLVLFVGFCAFIAWANLFEIDQVARARGKVIASSRVQVIKAVDGGVLKVLNVREGDRVQKGDVLARLDDTRFAASVQEIEARLFALRAKAVRLKAEVTGKTELIFPDDLRDYDEILSVETALFKQRRQGLNDELEALARGIELAKEEVNLIKGLKRLGDINRSEEIRAERSLNDLQIKLVTRRNRYLEESSEELARTENALAQNEQVLRQRKQQLKDSVFVAMVPGIVKNIQVTTIGGVLRSGEELMQIIPVDDDLVIEAKVSPVDIALVRKDLDAMVRFDPFDYTIFGGVAGKVVYVSADTLQERSARGDDIYYRVHITTSPTPLTTTGKQLEILPGMTTQVDIRTGKRTLLEYLLKPLRKTLSQSLKER